MNLNIGTAYFVGFIISLSFLIGGLLRLIIRPISNMVAYLIPWFFVGVGFQIGKGKFLPDNQQVYYWHIFISAIVFTFILRTIVANIEFKKTGEVGYFSDSGNMFIIGGLIGMIAKLFF